MANEYLKRQPTSTGNRKVFTWSGWVKTTKESKAGNGNDVFFCASSNNTGSTVYHRTRIGKFVQDPHDFGFNHYDGANDNYAADADFRDFSSWSHYLCSVDTTKEQTTDRVKIYVNGAHISDLATVTAINQNLNTFVNGLTVHYLGADGWNTTPSTIAKISMFDVFMVDGQTLTPDVFGFYKEGKGYQSSGTTQATDFRPGQWSPHSPRKIKTEIERKGGFGVNGFYLPMNDSSNFGADFHCAPDSIIKLKGEDLPQPRNGAPDTTDAYVSQLRQEVGTLGFDGVVDFRSSNTNTLQDSGDAINIGTNDFTVEAFVYHTDIPQNSLQYIFMSTAQSNTNTFAFAVESDRIIAGIYAGTWSNATKVEGALPVGSLKTGQWYHYAACRSGTTLRLFINGKMIVEDTSHTENYNNTSQYGCRVGNNNNSGASQGGAKAIRGFLSNVRVVNGTALYTSNFTPPTSALTAVPNTVLLCCQSTTDPTEAAVSPGTLSVLTNGGGLTATRNELTGSIVLAVPGISTATGSNLITNGSFDSDVSGWGVSGGTFTWNNGRAQHVTTSNVPVYQQITGLTIGQRYTFQYTHYSGYTSAYVSTNTNSGGSILSLGDAVGSSEITKRGSFTATATSHYVIIYGIGSHTSIWDDVVVKQEDAPKDYSADIKGSGTNKTPTLSGKSGVGYELGGYYGSAYVSTSNDDSLEFPGTSGDFNVGTGDFTIEMWLNPDSSQPTNPRLFGQDGNSAGNWDIYIAGTSTSNQIRMMGGGIDLTGGNGSSFGNLVSDQWNHFCLERYNGQLTTYVNGVVIYTQSYTSSIGDNNPFRIGQIGSNVYGGITYGFNGKIQDFRFYKGVAKYKGGFDVPKPYAPVGVENWRQVSDTCKNNFAILNPLSYQTTGTYGSSFPALSNGNLTYTHGQGGQWERSNSTMGVGEGKWYFEFEVVTRPVTGNTENWAVGLRESDSSLFYQCTDGFEDLGDHVYWIDAGTAKIVSNQDRSAGSTSGITAAANGDIINIAFEKTATALKVWFGKNGTYFNSGNPATGSNPAVNHSTTSTFIIPAVAYYRYSGQEQPVATFNFGQNPTFSGTKTAGTNADGNGKGLFKYQPPTDFLALCEDNLPTPTIADPGEHFKTVLYTGDGNQGHSITGVGFKPDLVWIKCRSHADNHTLSDTVRGPGLALYSDLTNVEHVSNIRIQSFNDDGFTTGSSGDTNTSGRTFCAWCWKAGGAAVTNTDGSITSQVSVNQDAGFSIVSWTSNGASSVVTTGHGLAKTPKFVLIKNRNATDNWFVYHSDIQTNNRQYLQLNTNSTTLTLPSNDLWSTFDTSTFGVRQSAIAANGAKIIAYCWTEIEGFSKFGSYVGNASADGTFVYCGFKPAFILIKKTTGSDNWTIKSNHISTNPNDYTILPDLPDTEFGPNNTIIDFVSNGFKMRTTSGLVNGAETYVFAAFAESPFQTANAK